MSVINQMLKDLEQRQQGSEGAVYVPPVRQQGWWMLLLTLICGLALGILGWRTWIYWQQSQRVVEARQLQVAGEQQRHGDQRRGPAISSCHHRTSLSLSSLRPGR